MKHVRKPIVPNLEKSIDKTKSIFDNTKVGIETCYAKNKNSEMLHLALNTIEFIEGILHALPDILFEVDREGMYCNVWTNDPSLLAMSKENLVGHTVWEVLDAENADVCMAAIRKADEYGKCIGDQISITLPNGIKWFELSISKFSMSEDTARFFVLSRDITERKQNEEVLCANEARLREAQKIAKLGSWELEFPGLKLFWSDEIYRIFEISPNQFEPSFDHLLNLIHPEDRNRIDTLFAESLKHKTAYDVVHRVLMSDGRIKYVHELGKTVYDENGNPLRSVGTVQDITDRKVIEQEMYHMAHHDALTGLPNRILVKAKAEQVISHAKKAGSKVAFFFIDLDGFKTINDTFGHSAGDATLKTISSRLKQCVRESDILSRQGGDEFLLILSDIQEYKLIVSTAEKFLAAMEKSFEVHAHTLSLSGSIGISLYPDHGDTFEFLLKSADAAMYKAKESGKNSYHFYTQQMTHDIIGQFKIQNDLKDALKNNEFILYYQPQIDLTTNRIIGVEALIRWRHPQMGMIPPMSFISLAESNGLIVPIGQWVIEEACRQLAIWQQNGINVCIAVNISAMQFKRGNLEEVVKNAILDSKINPKQLELELTESIIMHDTENTLQCVRNLKELGIQLSLDDFGTGYSSLAYLKRFAVDKLKIDQSFVRDILEDREDAVIVKTIIQMAKNLNLKTIAEGVENAQVLSVIDAYGCDEVQGYHFAKPMESLAFESFYSNFKHP